MSEHDYSYSRDLHGFEIIWAALLLYIMHYRCVYMCVLSYFSRVWLFVTTWTMYPPGSFVHGILQAWILEWDAMPSSRGSSQPRDRTSISFVFCIGRGVLCHLGNPNIVYSIYIYQWLGPVRVLFLVCR